MISRDVIKFISYITLLVAVVALILFILISGMELGPFKALSIKGISDRSKSVQKTNMDLAVAEQQYDSNIKTLEKSKKEFNSQKEAYELISDETINAVKEATKEEEYLIEYIWITLGNYATAHDLELAIIEPGGSVGQSQATTTDTGNTDVSTGTGVTGNSTGVNSAANPGTTGTTTSGATQTEQADTPNQSTSVTSGLTSKADALTVQVKGTYMDLADFVFEVENDQSLRFRLDNIKMTSAGGTEVIASFNVKDFTVLKYLE